MNERSFIHFNDFEKLQTTTKNFSTSPTMNTRLFSTAVNAFAAPPTMLPITSSTTSPAPSTICKASPQERLRGLADYLNTQIKGQPHVIERVVSVLHRGELGLAHQDRPKGSFLFVGPTGTGKTEITNAFTAYLFNGAKPLRFDMSEYQNQSSVEKLIGGNPDEMGLLGRALAHAQSATSKPGTPPSDTSQPDAMRSNTPCSNALQSGTLLFDEIEKAHPLVLDLFLQILDDASITLATGERCNLAGFYIVCTSNIGAAEAMRMQSAPFASIERTVLARVNQQLRPELVARMTERIVFNRLPFEVQREICNSMIAAELRRLHALGHDPKITAPALHITETDIETILREGYHKTLGARPMRATVERFLQERFAKRLLGETRDKPK
jgi:ATP-dependent Clp protease ATP-binding subunit ClpB